ncbi:hypothetical protein [Phaeodactylibacter xiamenensis]|uniref:hypothetical protein n=1 Tax=Phaeodactylibacter xiamenensis TaxID=1524460 RepID=UPI003BAB1908
MKLNPESLLRLILMPLIKEVESIVIQYEAKLRWHSLYGDYSETKFLTFSNYPNVYEYKSEVLDKMVNAIKYDAEAKLLALKNLDSRIDQNSIESIFNPLRTKVKDKDEQGQLLFKEAQYNIVGPAYVEHPVDPDNFFWLSITKEKHGRFFHDDLLPFANQLEGIIEELDLHLQYLLMTIALDSATASDPANKNSIPDNIQSHIKSLIEQANISEAINLLKTYAEDENDKELRDSMLMLSFQWKSNEDKKLRKTVSDEAASLEENKIVSSLLSIIR